jgi:membrane protein
LIKKSEKDRQTIKSFFIDHKLMHYAASLSFHTVLALVPILLLSFFIFTKLPMFEQYLGSIKGYIFSAIIPVHQELIAQNIDNFLKNTNSLGYIGVVFVLYVSLMFFDDFEYVINNIFHVQPRSFFHSMSLYFIITILTPIGLAISLYLSIYATGLLHSYNHVSIAIYLFSISSFLIAWLLFMELYFLAANTKVFLKSAVLASFVASFVWFVSKKVFITYIGYNITYSTIYGSFSTIMFFMLWIYISWVIFLYGVKLCYILNKSYHQKKHNEENISKAILKYRKETQKEIDNQKP